MQEQTEPMEAREPAHPQQPQDPQEQPQGKETIPELRRPRRDRLWKVMLYHPRFVVPRGIAASNGFGLLVMLATYWFASRAGSNAGGLLVASDFMLLPMVMGGICAYFWREAKLSTADYILYTFLNAGVAVLLSAIFLREGVICLLMASPLLVLFMLLGGVIQREIQDKIRRPRFHATLVPLALVLFVVDSLMPHHFENHETDRIVIHASPQRVWQYIIDYPANHTPSDYWLTHLGLPAPVQSTATGHAVGATRRCLFTGDVVFEEKITDVEPNRKLEFDVVRQPNYPEIVGHLVLQKGRFLLTDNHDGTTTVEGTSWYQLKVYPVSYFDLWTQDVIRHVHLRVMRHIKRLAESGR